MKELEEPILKLKPTQNKIYLLLEKHAGTFAVLVFLSFITFGQDVFKFVMAVTIIYLLYSIANIIITTIRWRKVEYVFYDSKVIVEDVKKQEKFNYCDLEDIIFMQSRVQKMFNIGYLRLKKNDGNVLTKNIDLKPLDNFNNVMEKMTGVKL